jgi:hypothetical protein
MRKDVAFACERFQVSERRACKLLGMDRGSYRYEPRPDRNVQLREALVALARQDGAIVRRLPLGVTFDETSQPTAAGLLCS